jgi:transcription elongation GreA/GreB family factor
MNASQIKSLLYEKCLTWVESRMLTAKNAMQTAQEAANAEEKSSAGDKYETTRAMMQNESMMAARQLDQALKLKQIVEKTDINESYDYIKTGSLVITDTQRYFICISAGKIIIEEQAYFAISSDSPVGLLLCTHKAGETINFQDKKIIIREIF